MSRSNKSAGMRNPAVRTLEWKGSKGHWRYWDGDKKEEVEVKSVRIAPLDVLSSISGFAEAYQASGFSNEVHSVMKEPLKVMVFVGKSVKVVAKGFYSDIKGELPAGLKFTKAVYGLDLDDGQIVRLLMQGSALNGWIDAELDTNRGGIKQESTVQGKKGAVIFQKPVFEACEITKEQDELAVAADRKLQEYLASKREELHAAAEHEEPKAEEGPTDLNDEDEIPF